MEVGTPNHVVCACTRIAHLGCSPEAKRPLDGSPLGGEVKRLRPTPSLVRAALSESRSPSGAWRSNWGGVDRSDQVEEKFWRLRVPWNQVWEGQVAGFTLKGFRRGTVFAPMGVRRAPVRPILSHPDQGGPSSAGG